MNLKYWLSAAALLLALAVAAGAFGAHALRDKVEPLRLVVYEKGVFYHFVHALGMLLVGLLAATNIISEPMATKVLSLLLVGILVFSGSLYALVITDTKWLGAITPIGGVSFIAAWVLLAVGIMKTP